MGKARILCVDSDRATTAIISMILKREGFEVEVAYDGDEGLKKAREMKPDLLILEIMIPITDGYQVCRRLRDDPETAGIGVLILTTKGGVDEDVRDAWKFAARVQDRLKGYEMGALDFLTKPVKAKDLVQRVKAVLWASGIAV